jgi:hypothetical protein
VVFKRLKSLLFEANEAWLFFKFERGTNMKTLLKSVIFILAVLTGLSILPQASEAYTITTGAGQGSTYYNNSRKLAVSSNGHLHAVYHRLDSGGIMQIYHAESANGGITWVEEQITTASRDQWFPALAIDSQDTLHLAWTDGWYEVGNVYYKKKTTVWQDIPEFVASCAGGPSIAVDSNDDVHIVYGVNTYGSCGYSGGIRYRKRTSAGLQGEEPVSQEKYWANFPAIAIDKDNNVHVAWLNSPRAIYYDIHYRKRTLSGWGDTDRPINLEKGSSLLLTHVHPGRCFLRCITFFRINSFSL